LFPDEFGRHQGQSGDISPRPSEPDHESDRHGIDDCGHDDRNGARRVVRGLDRRRGVGREVGKPVIPPLSKPGIDDDVLALDVAEIAQPLPEGAKQGRATQVGS